MWGAGGVCGRSFRWKFGGRGKFEGGVVWLRGVIDEKREKFVGEVGGRVVWLRVCGWWVYFRYVGV